MEGVMDSERSHIMKSMKRWSGLHILIVDDDANSRDMLSQMLKLMGFEVTTAENGSVGLDYFLRNAFELVITDLEMPDMDGWSLSRYLKNNSPDIPILMVTGNPSIRQSGRDGDVIDGLILKPFLFTDIQRALLKLLKKTRPAGTQTTIRASTALP